MTASAEPGPEDVVLRIRDITKRFGGLVANDAIDLDLKAGEILALLGENGAGKTTLMNILFGHYLADEGEILVAAPNGGLQALKAGSPHAALAAGIGMVHQHFTLAENLSVLDNILLGTEPLWRPMQKRREAREKLAGLMDQAGLQVGLDGMVSSLSVGERQRVEILKALYRDARILILDEPTAVLTPQEVEGLFDTLRRLAGHGLSVVFISHKLAEVLDISDRVMVLRGGRVVADLPSAGTDRAHLAETMVGRPIPATIRSPIEPGEVLLALDRVRVPGTDRWTGLTETILRLQRHEIVGIAGVSGNGQAALAGLICGLVRHDAGEMRLFGRREIIGSPLVMVTAGVGRIPEDRLDDGVVGDMEVWENLLLEDYRADRFQQFSFIRQAEAQAHAKQVITDFDIKCPGPRAMTRLLSGGNIQKLILGRVLDRRPDLIVANQPARGLDIGAVTYVHQRLLEARERGAGIVLISEDLDELLTLSDRVAVMYRGRLSPTMPTESVTIRQLGLMMAGQKPEEPEVDAA